MDQTRLEGRLHKKKGRVTIGNSGTPWSLPDLAPVREYW